MHPATAPVWLAGLVYCLASPRGRPYRLLAFVWIGVFLILAASGSARSYYLAPAYAAVFAAGGVAVERWVRARQRLRWVPAMLGMLLLAAGGMSAPLVVPLLSPDAYAAYERRLGFERPPTEFEEGLLPPQFGFQFGWPELTATVVSAYRGLDAAERRAAGVLAFTFGDAAAINFYGQAAALPRAAGTHNAYWLWGPLGYSGEVMLVVAGNGVTLTELFQSCERAGGIDCTYCMPELRARAVFVCRGARRPLAALWPELKDYS
jgi:hypothetical protein